MYESFFGFESRPFAAAPNTKLYFPAGAIEHARQTLARSIERADGVAVVIGPTGTGKSLLLSLLADQFQSQFHTVTLASARLCTRRALLQNILFELKLPYRNMEEGELRLSLIDHLEPDSSSGMLLLVDEAHTLPLRLLEEIRMITNLVRDGEPRVRLVLGGARSLEERLAHPKLDSLNQRVSARCFLEALSGDETRAMVRQQIQCAGGAVEDVFTEEALTAIHQATDGVPRLINQVADHALLLASVGGVKPVHAEGVSEAWADLQQLPLPWNAANPERESASSIEFGSLDDDSLLSDSLFAEPTLEDEQFTPAPAAEDLDQVELRVAPETRKTSGVAAGASSGIDDETLELIGLDGAQDSDEAKDVVAMSTALDASDSEELDMEFADSGLAPTLPELDIAELPDDAPPTLAMETPREPLLGEDAAELEVMDDPFSEQFDAEEVVIEATELDPAAVRRVNGTPLAREIAELLPDSLVDDIVAARESAPQGWTIDVEAIDVAPIIEVAQASLLDGVIGDDAVISAESVEGDLLGRPDLLNAELADHEEWEPAYPAITADETRSLEPEAEPRLALDSNETGELEIDDHDIIVVDDEPSAPRGPTPKARAIVRDYRRLFAQLRRG